MRTHIDPDASLELRESPAALRTALLLAALAVPWGAWTAGRADRLGVILGFLGGAMFLAGALLTESRWYRFDRSTNAVRWQRSRLLLSGSGTLPFGSISAVVAQGRMEDDNPRTRRMTYRPVMLTSEGEMLLSNQTSLSAEDFSDLLAMVRGVFGLTESEGSDPIVDLVRAGRILDATALLRRHRGMSLSEARRGVDEIRRRLGDAGGV